MCVEPDSVPESVRQTRADCLTWQCCESMPTHVDILTLGTILSEGAEIGNTERGFSLDSFAQLLQQVF